MIVMSFFSVCCFILYLFLNYIIYLSAVWFPCYKFYKCMYMTKWRTKIYYVLLLEKNLNKTIFHKCLFRFKFQRSERTHIIISTLTLRKMHHSSKEFQTTFFSLSTMKFLKKWSFPLSIVIFLSIRILQYI